MNPDDARFGRAAVGEHTESGREADGPGPQSGREADGPGPQSGVVLGVDGCPGGWIGALVERGTVRWVALPTVAAALALPAAAVGIDMPIGLADGGPRDCDRAARALLGRPRASSVFPAPPRAALHATTYAEACALSRAAQRTALPLQTFHLLGKIRELDAALTPDDQRRVLEVHPEVSFRLLAPGPDLGPKKRTAGRAARLTAVRRWLPAVSLADLPGRARPDDALDALACAWTAARWLAGTARVLPDDDPPRDARGLRMEIVG